MSNSIPLGMSKYVVVRDQEAGEQAIVFSTGLSHDTFKYLSPTSAGFFTFAREEEDPNALTLVVSSEISWTLRIGPAEGDSLLIAAALGIPVSSEPGKP